MLAWRSPLTRILLVSAVAALVACPEEDDGTGDEMAGDDDDDDDADGTGDDDDDGIELGCAAGVVGETTDGATMPTQDMWGAPCNVDADCVPLIGEGAECVKQAVIYEMPGGYCSKPCTLPDADTRFVLDAEDCDPEGGVACIGQKGIFERCAVVCSDDMQCRDGFQCRVMPMIGAEGDATTCLMPDCCLDTCAEE